MAEMHRPRIMSHQQEWAGIEDSSDEGTLAWLDMFPRVLAIDPGGITGWCALWFDPEVIVNRELQIDKSVVAWHAGMHAGPENGQVDSILRQVRRLGVSPYEETGELGVIVENFTLQANVPTRNMELLSPVRITAALRYPLWKGVRCKDGQLRTYSPYLQMASDAKTTITDARLKMWDMYLPGPDHPRDATRHALLWLRRLRGQAGLLEQVHKLRPEDFERD